MKHSFRFLLSLSTFLGISFLMIQPTFADIINEGEHWVDICVRINNNFPNSQLIGYIKGVSGPTSSYIIQSDTCLTKGYKFNYFSIIGHRGSDAVNLETVSPESVFSDPKNFSQIYTSGIEYDLALNEKTVPDINPLSKQTIEYSVMGMNGKTVLYKSKVTSEYNDNTPTKVETFPAPSVKDIFGFTDSDAGNYTNALQYIAQNHIAQGFSDGTFRPNQTITRAELLKIILNSKSIATDSTAKNCFTDVSEQWQVNYVCTAKKLGIVGGYDDGTFKPNQNISFIEALKIIERAYGTTIANSNPWYKAYVEDASKKNIIPLDIVYFNQTLNRGQMADIITRYMKLNDSEYSRDDYIKYSFGSAGLTPVTYDMLTLHK